MKHLINILNVFLAIYACRAMGCFGVPLIFHWRRGTCEGSQGAGFAQDACWESRPGDERGKSSFLLQIPAGTEGSDPELLTLPLLKGWS
jgi:hypothetical protein